MPQLLQTLNVSRAAALRGSLWVLWGLIPLSALAVGGLSVPVVIIAVPAAIAAFLAFSAGASRYGATSAPVVGLAGLALLCALQAVPIPLSVLSKLDGATADIWSRCLLPVGGEVHYGSISLAPATTVSEAAKWASYACVLGASATLTRSRGPAACLQIIVVSSAIVALATIAHQMADAKSVFGLYTPAHDFGAGAVVPLLNPNHLAGYLNLGALAALGLELSPRRGVPKGLMGALAIFDIAMSLRTASRGGAASLLLGLVVLGILVFAAPVKGDRRGPSRTVGLTVLLGTAALGIGLAAFGFDRKLWMDLTDLGIDKVRIGALMKPMILDHPIFGIGRGSFESAFEAYQPPTHQHVVLNHPENIVAQWTCEWGGIGAVALCAFAWILCPWRSGVAGSASASGAAAAVVALGLQNLVDFSLELPGIALAFSVAAGVVWGASKRETRHMKTTKGSVAARWVLPAATVVISLVSAILRVPPIGAARIDIQRQLASKSNIPQEVRASVVRMMRWYPAEYYFPLAGAALALQGGDNPIPWIQRALERGPSIGRTHLLLAEALAARGAMQQALLELRIAVDCESGLADIAAQSALRWSDNEADLLRAVPLGSDGAPMLDTMAARALSAKNRNLELALDHASLGRDPGRRGPLVRLAEGAMQSLSDGTCTDSLECEEELRLSAMELDSRFPQSSLGPQLLARFAVQDGDLHRARTILREACDRPEDIATCLGLLAPIEEEGRIQAVVDRYVAIGCSTNQSCAEANEWVASFEESRGALGLALGAAERSARFAPSRVRWMRTASLAERAGQRLNAIRALEQALHFPGDDDQTLRSRIDLLRRTQLEQ